MAPGHYDAVTPSLATKWERLPDSAAWRFTLDPAATFASGAKLTPEDCRFSLDRARRTADGAGQFVTNITTIAVSGLNAIDIELHRPDEAFLSTLASPQFAILERTVVEAQDNNAAEWLNQHSAGSGPYVLSGWSRRQSIQLTANPRPWRDPAAFRRITVAHIPYPAAQLRAIQKGDIDVAFNLIPEQIAALESDRSVRIETVRSLDFVYLALTADPAVSKPLSTIAVRQALASAIDYEDLLGRLLGGSATRPAHFLPIGVPGSTAAIAAQIGYHQNVDRARTLLREAGFADGIEIQLSYADDAIAGITYHSLARKLQTDLGRVGIKLKLDMKNPANLRADYVAGKLQAVLAFWHPPIIENRVWAEATIDRVGKRLGWTAPNAIPPLIADASATPDPARAATLWSDFQAAMVEQATLIPLFQPTYQVAIRTSVAKFPLTAAGWMADLSAAKPA
jgi:peptide/nickel transport system substrate-binding protein